MSQVGYDYSNIISSQCLLCFNVHNSKKLEQSLDVVKSIIFYSIFFQSLNVVYLPFNFNFPFLKLTPYDFQIGDIWEGVLTSGEGVHSYAIKQEITFLTCLDVFVC